MATGYAGGDHYVNQRAVVDGDLITAGPQSPVQFPTQQRCGAGAWQRIASSRRTRELSPGRHDRLPSAHGRPRRSMSVAHKGHHCSAA
jgi:hypothetical protein